MHSIEAQVLEREAYMSQTSLPMLLLLGNHSAGKRILTVVLTTIDFEYCLSDQLILTVYESYAYWTLFLVLHCIE
jgi:hypothetical protein